MILSSLLSAGAFGLAAQAFLVIPETNSLPDVKDNDNSAAPSILETSKKTVKLDCSTCPFALNTQRNGAHEWTGNVKSYLELNLATKDDSLTLNDVPFFPLRNPALPPRLTVFQTKYDNEPSQMEGFEGQLGLSYSLEYSEKKFKDNTLVTVGMILMGLDGQMIRVENVEIKAIKGANGKVRRSSNSIAFRGESNFSQLMIHSVNVIPASPNAPDAKCENILCRVFTKVLTGVHKAKASAKGAAHRVKCVCLKCLKTLTGVKHIHDPSRHHGGKVVPHRRPDGTVELPSHIQFRPAGHHGDYGFPRHHQKNGFLASVAAVARIALKVVFIPILIGVAFGMAASAIGMLVGQAIVFLWLKFRRTPENGAYERVEAEEKEAPPAYQDVQGEGAEAMDEKEVETKA